MDDRTVLAWVLQVVQVESPVHIDETAFRIASAAGLKRAGTRIRARVRNVARQGGVNGGLSIKGDFLWRIEDELPGRLRKPEMIAPEEIGAALQQAVQASHGIDADGAVTEASRLFGFKRVGREIQTRFKAVLRDLVTVGILQEGGGQLRPVRTNDDDRG